MGKGKTWIDLALLGAATAAALLLFFYGVDKLEASNWMIFGHPTLGVISIVMAGAVVNCLILIGFGVVKARSDWRR